MLNKIYDYFYIIIDIIITPRYFACLLSFKLCCLSLMDVIWGPVVSSELSWFV